MPTYNYLCEEHSYFECKQLMKDHANADCPDCGNTCKQVILSAPGLDLEAMAKVGMPGAWDTVGDRITKRHKEAGQSHQ